jgi:hypothetical protein
MTIDQTHMTGVSLSPGAGNPSRTPVAHVTRIEPDPSTQPDSLAAAVLNSLTRPIYFPLSWGVLTSFVATMVTLGVLPAFAIPRWLRGVMAQHEQQLWHLSEWLRLNTGSEDAVALQTAANRIGFNRVLGWISYFCGTIAVVVLLLQLRVSHFNTRSVYELAVHPSSSLTAMLFTCLVGSAAIFNWVHILWHQRNINRYLVLFNQFAIEQEWRPIPLPRAETGTRPLWLLAGVSLFLIGAIWGLPVMLAMGAHRRYTMRTSVRVRAELAERMRTLLKAQQPPLRVPDKPMTILGSCSRRICRSQISFDVTFCPRCGMRVA